MARNLPSPANEVLQVHAPEQDSDFEIDFVDNEENMDLDMQTSDGEQYIQDIQSDLEEGEIKESSNARKSLSKRVSFDLSKNDKNTSVFPRSNGLFSSPMAFQSRSNDLFFTSRSPKNPKFADSAWMKSSPIDFTKSERLKETVLFAPNLSAIQEKDETDGIKEKSGEARSPVFKISNELQLEWLSKKYDPPVKCETIERGRAQPAHEKPGGTLPILIQLMSPNIKIPSRAYPGSAGYDVFSPVNVVIPPKQRRKINLRFKIKMPTGWYLEMKQRSSVSIHKRIKLEGQPCTIDSDYRGWIFIYLSNHGFEPYRISEGDKLVQLIPHRVPKIAWFTCDNISVEEGIGQRGIGGFGSSGR